MNPRAGRWKSCGLSIQREISALSSRKDPERRRPTALHMRYIEPHGHMVSRTTDDYQAMVTAGCVAVCEPAFWAGYDRKNKHGFYDYFLQLTEYEPRRAKKYHLPHFCWLCINPKEAEDVALAEDVIALIPELLAKPNVLGIGEIGLNKNSRNELVVLEKHIQLAADHDQLILVHTPRPSCSMRVSGPASRFTRRAKPLPTEPSTCWNSTATSAFGSTAPATGATAIPSPCRRPRWKCAAAATTRFSSTRCSIGIR